EGTSPLRKALEGPAIIGRAHDADIFVDDKRLSRHHCRLEPKENGWAVMDLNSTNGTFVQGNQISYHQLRDGDELIVGRTRMIFHERAAPPRRPATPQELANGGPSPGIPS